MMCVRHSALSESCGSSEKSLRSFMSNKLPCDFSHNSQASSQALECQKSLSSKSLDSKNSSLRDEAEAIHKDRANPHLQIHKANTQSIDCHGDKSPRNDEISETDKEVSESSTHANSTTLKENEAAGFSMNFKGCQARGEGSYLSGSDRAESEDSLKSREKPTQNTMSPAYLLLGRTHTIHKEIL